MPLALGCLAIYRNSVLAFSTGLKSININTNYSDILYLRDEPLINTGRGDAFQEKSHPKVSLEKI